MFEMSLTPWQHLTITTVCETFIYNDECSSLDMEKSTERQWGGEYGHRQRGDKMENMKKAKSGSQGGLKGLEKNDKQK